jgi:[acyl-carrier-protein] S-malonyltransferase
MDSIAFVFPGQGAQAVGMGKDLYDNFAEAQEVFAQADDALGYRISSLCFDGPEEKLNLTANTQPAILTASIAALNVLTSRLDIEPVCLAGHSLGEYSALVAGQAVTFTDAVQAVHKRGQFMQEAVPAGQGAMAAILGLQREQLEELCGRAAQGEVLTPANFNCPGQTVISGHAGAVERALPLAKEMGARRAVQLNVSGPFHSQLMEPAGKRLEEALAGISFSPLRYPVVTNVEATENQDAGRIKDLLVQQVSSPVLWEDSVNLMLKNGVDTFIEIGPGKVLTGLIKRVTKSASFLDIEDSDSLNALETAWKERN